MLKNIITGFLAILFFCSSAPCFAISELYYIKNAQKNSLDNKINNALLADKYSIIKKNPFHAVKVNKKANYIVIILRQSGQNVFYYYNSNHNNKITKNFLKDLSGQNIEYLKSTNQSLLDSFEQTAQQTLSGTTKTYSFADDYDDYDDYMLSQQSNPMELTGYVAMVGKGSKLDAYLQNPINTATAQVGDNVQAILKKDWVVNKKVIAPQGSMISGTLTKAQHAARGMRNGKVSITFTNIVTPDNKTYKITAKVIDFDVSNDGVVSKTVANVVAGAAVGALAGLLIGLAANNGHVGSDTAIGAGIGAGGVLTNEAVQKGVDAEIPSYTDIEVEISENIRVIFRD